MRKERPRSKGPKSSIGTGPLRKMVLRVHEAEHLKSARMSRCSAGTRRWSSAPRLSFGVAVPATYSWQTPWVPRCRGWGWPLDSPQTSPPWRCSQSLGSDCCRPAPSGSRARAAASGTSLLGPGTENCKPECQRRPGPAGRKSAAGGRSCRLRRREGVVLRRPFR